MLKRGQNTSVPLLEIFPRRWLVSVLPDALCVYTKTEVYT